jgi:hypothetical protein
MAVVRSLSLSIENISWAEQKAQREARAVSYIIDRELSKIREQEQEQERRQAAAK